MSEIDLFVSSTGNFTLILVLVCSVPVVSHLRCAGAHAQPLTHRVRIDFAGSEGSEGMKVDNIKPQKIVIVSPVGHGVIVQERSLTMELDEKFANHLPALGKAPTVFAQEQAVSI